jgi:hypothetical protein
LSAMKTMRKRISSEATSLWNHIWSQSGIPKDQNRYGNETYLMISLCFRTCTLQPQRKPSRSNKRESIIVDYERTLTMTNFIMLWWFQASVTMLAACSKLQIPWICSEYLLISSWSMKRVQTLTSWDLTQLTFLWVNPSSKCSKWAVQHFWMHKSIPLHQFNRRIYHLYEENNPSLHLESHLSFSSFKSATQVEIFNLRACPGMLPFSVLLLWSCLRS